MGLQQSGQGEGCWEVRDEEWAIRWSRTVTAIERTLQFSSAQSLSHVRLFATPWAVAHQAPPSMGFSRQEYWSELPFLSPGDLPDPGIEPRSPALWADALTSEPPGGQTFLWSLLIHL